MKPKPSNILTQTLLNLGSLITSFGSSCPTNMRFGRAEFSINTRWRQLDLVLRRLSDDIELIRKARQGLVDLTEVHELLRAAPSLDLEIFYVIVRSLLDDVAILTPFFYPKGEVGPRSRSFNGQLKWYRNNPDFDPPMTRYLETQLGWFDELKALRDDLLHGQCDILPIEIATEGAHESMPISLDIQKESGLQLVQLESPRTILKNLLGFLNFYSSHFKDRIPNDWPCYKDLFGPQPKGSVHGLEFLKRWSE